MTVEENLVTLVHGGGAIRGTYDPFWKLQNILKLFAKLFLCPICHRHPCLLINKPPIFSLLTPGFAVFLTCSIGAPIRSSSECVVGRWLARDFCSSLPLGDFVSIFTFLLDADFSGCFHCLFLLSPLSFPFISLYPFLSCLSICFPLLLH